MGRKSSYIEYSYTLQEVYEIEKEYESKIADLEAKLAESEKKASKNYQEGYDLYLSLKQFYSRLGVEAYPDDEIQDVAIKELNKFLKENDQLKQQLAERFTEKDVEGLIKDREETIKFLKQQLAEKDDAHMKAMQNAFNDFLQLRKEQNQTSIAVLEEMLDNEVYINSKLNFEDGNYVLSKIIRTKIEELRNGRN